MMKLGPLARANLRRFLDADFACVAWAAEAAGLDARRRALLTAP